jgi:cell division protein ZapA
MPKAEIDILGQKYSIKGDVPEDEMKRLAAYVDLKIKEVLRKSPGTTPLNAAILAALNIAGEFESYRKEQEGITRNISEKAFVLTSLFD